jgi:hypothetical protein
LKADYDSQANALGIELVEVDRWDDGYEFDDDYCNLGFAGGRLVYIGLLHPSQNLQLLEAVAESYDLDAGTVLAAAKAALAAPDLTVTISDRVAV